MTTYDEVSRIRREEYASTLIAEVEADNTLDQLYRDMQSDRETDGRLLFAHIAELDAQLKAAVEKRKRAEIAAYGFIFGEDSYL